MPIRGGASLLAAVFLCLKAACLQAALSPAAEKVLDEGLTHLYNLDYERSRSTFRKLIELEPDNPFGYLFESGAIWWQASQEYGLFKDTPTLQGLFEQDVEAALRKAAPLLDSPDKSQRADGYFVAGMALGTRGQWSLLRGHWMQAYFDGKKAVKYLKKCVKIDPSYHDAYLGLGVFDYQAARLPAIIQYSPLIGIRGNEERGLERMHQAAQLGRFGSRQARQLLTSIYIIDKKDYTRAFALLARLREDFPQSPYFNFIDVLLRHRMGDSRGSLREAANLFEKMRSSPVNFDRKLLSLFCGLTAPHCLDRQAAQSSLDWLDKALSAPETKKRDHWRALLRLLRGQALDILERRQEAMLEYKRVLASPDFAKLRQRAGRCLLDPCLADETLDYLRSLSKADS
jgi:tetratricopeptide (TPR) repeat protein